MALNAQRRRFVEEFLIDANATQAYIRAGYKALAADSNSAHLMAQPEIQEAIAEAQAARSARTEITADMVLQRLWSIATADPTALVEYRRTCCHHCWGIEHAYQWTASEFDSASAKAKDRKQLPPTCDGGFGFDRTREPHPDCPECRGEGVGTTHVNDTRHLTGPARLLYAGVKEGKDGLEVKTHDQMKALEMVARTQGLFKDKGDTPVAISFTISSDDANL